MTEHPLILVVEDEYLLQADLEEALAGAGFATNAVSSAEEAITLLQGAPSDRFKAIVTDVGLNGRMTGWAFARRARQLQSSIPIVYVTGQGRDWPSEGVPQSILVEKPFAPAQVVTALSNLLNAGNVSPPA